MNSPINREIKKLGQNFVFCNYMTTFECCNHPQKSCLKTKRLSLLLPGKWQQQPKFSFGYPNFQKDMVHSERTMPFNVF